MPVNRAGKVVRCPECKRIIRLEKVSKTETMSGKPIPMTATSVDDPKIVDEASTTDLPTIDQTSAGLHADVDDRPRLIVPEKIAPTSILARKNAEPLAASKPDTPSSQNRPIDPDSVSDTPIIPDFANPENRKVELQQRVKASSADRKVLLKFFAACLGIVALVNLGPAVYHWIEWSQIIDSPALPRWIYLQAFVAVIHVVYAIYLLQIPDWSALKAVSVAMLVVAFVFGLVSTGLVAGGGQGAVAGFLELPHVLVYQASIWCVAMLLLSTLMCYMGGREALNWQRTEQLLREIVS